MSGPDSDDFADRLHKMRNEEISSLTQERDEWRSKALDTGKHPAVAALLAERDAARSALKEREAEAAMLQEAGEGLVDAIHSLYRDIGGRDAVITDALNAWAAAKARGRR